MRKNACLLYTSRPHGERVCSSEEKIKDVFKLADVGLIELGKTAFAAGDGGKALILNVTKFCKISAGCLELTGPARCVSETAIGPGFLPSIMLGATVVACLILLVLDLRNKRCV